MKPFDNSSLRNDAKCGPYDEEPGCSAVKVGPEESGKWRCGATRLVSEGCKDGTAQQVYGSHSSPGAAGAARMKEGWRNVGGTAWS
jgi:hypothetical protein